VRDTRPASSVNHRLSRQLGPLQHRLRFRLNACLRQSLRSSQCAAKPLPRKGRSALETRSQGVATVGSTAAKTFLMGSKSKDTNMRKNFTRGIAAVVTVIILASCGGGSGGGASPTNPTPAATRIIAIAGDLSFGDVVIGTTADRSFAVRNTGTAALTVTGMQGPGGLTASWTDGQIPAGGSQSVSLHFAPTEVRSYSGTVTVNADYTSGQNTIPINARGVAAPTPAPTPTPTPSAFSISGRVTDQNNGAALGGVSVVVKDRGISGTTDAAGRYTLTGVASGQYTLRGSKSGYELAEPTVAVSGNTTLDFTMRPTSSSPAPTPTPTPTPSPGPTPTPGPNGPTCTASSIPANAVCIGDGTPPVTAVCEDGTFSCSRNRSGTCSSHGKVACSVCPGILCNGLTAPTAQSLNYTPVPVPENSTRRR